MRGLFKNLILAEGGFHLVSRYENCKDRNIFFMYGDYGGVGGWLGRQGRGDYQKDVKKFIERAAENSLKVTAFVMPKTGHEVPARFDPDLKAWVDRQRGKQAAGTAAASPLGRGSTGIASRRRDGARTPRQEFSRQRVRFSAAAKVTHAR